ncbi:amino acid permease [Halalkalibacterium halodurans]|uniref:amino acid permease n=1 Tax=Halalkalibacterium halodurans TaxID=86665 RepID=UPI002E23EAD5|nr:amino acid permease [Halalkalibacterium halodurans]MED4087142.1 amino acid permease [Halalkalibacterium halodurans]MED4107015.1 amino acid permease [Halalkalibacterium halodurans]MED4110928.1 amino acid permease [Halalkalibacterium halodurans]MED4123643.1 amino acid permease [Halalkalibacterium halodurans]
MKASQAESEKMLKWWELSLLGVGCIIGTGFFLGSSIAIQMAGPSVLLAFILAGIGTYIVFDALAQMTSADPEKGSFRSYAKKAYGRWAGFTSGWVYWASEMLIMGSQLTALSIFSRFWFPDVPLWIFASGFAVLGIIVILTGSKGFDRIENLFAVMKVAAIVMFIALAILALFGVFRAGPEGAGIPRTWNGLFPEGFLGLWPALIFGFYAFGGIEIMGLLANRLEEKGDAAKSGRAMLLLLTFLYVVSVGLALILVPLNRFNTETSPFITALKPYGLPIVSHLFNGVLIIAGFSTMVASLFAVTSILVTLAADKDAPNLFAKKVKNKIALPAIGLTAIGMALSVVLSLLIPGRIYEYFTTAAGLMLLYNWLFIIASSGKLIQYSLTKRWIGTLFILLAVIGTLFHRTSRPGFLFSLGFLVVIGIVTLMMKKRWKQEEGDGKKRPSIFVKLKPNSE